MQLKGRTDMNYLNLIWDDIKQGKNISLIITIIVALLLPILKYFVPSLDQHIPALTLAVLALLTNALLSNRHQLERLYSSNEELSKAGIRKAYEIIPDSVLNELYRTASKEICILWTWTSRIDPLSAGLIEAAKRGTKVRILLLNPKSSIASQRLIDLGFQQDSTRPEVALEGLLKEISSRQLKNIHIRFYNALPPFILYRADETLMMGTLWHGHGSSKGPHIEIRGLSSTLGSYAMDTYEQLWQGSSSSI